MLSVIPAGIFSRLRIFLGRLKPHALPVARRHIVLGSIGAGTGLAVTSMFSHWLLGEVNLWFIAPMGASAVLLFGVPSSPLAQPWSIVGGNVLSALIGTLTEGVEFLRWLTWGDSVGFDTVNLDLAIINVSFSFKMQVNVLQVVLIGAALLLYKKVR